MADSDIVVSGLATAAGISYNALTYATDDPHEGGLLNQSLDVVEIWASQTNNRTTATKVAEGNKTNSLHVALGNGETWYYWIKARNKQGYHGEWYPLSPTAGVQGITAIITVTDAGVPTSWSSYTPEITSTNGALGAVTSILGRYMLIGDACLVNAQFEITNNGTGTSSLQVSLPFDANFNVASVGVGRRLSDGAQLRMLAGGPTLGGPGLPARVFLYDGSYPGAVSVFNVSMVYQIEP